MVCCSSVSANGGVSALVSEMRRIAVDELHRTYLPEQRLFAFTLRRTDTMIAVEGQSLRYSAIVLIGLAGESGETSQRALHGESRLGMCHHLVEHAAHADNLGDVALALWAARLLGHEGWNRLHQRMCQLDPVAGHHPTVEVAWALTATCANPDLTVDRALADKIAGRLMQSYQARSAMFPHWPMDLPANRLRGHVVCFADLVYPIVALSHFGSLTRTDQAVGIARACARRMCALQGPNGQWWWHYDHRSGRVLEEYPVYAVHQDAMAPMALIAAQQASGECFDEWIDRGLQWLCHSPEINASLIDGQAKIIWRKVCRREPGKLTRSLQAIASRIHPSLRVPLVNQVFPPVCVDFESRPYHMGWILYAWQQKERIDG
jgi:hypothetical protein